jgi:hypothetical protein
MICPFCKEVANDEAVVCSHCGKDLTLYKPLNERIASLESELASLVATVDRIPERILEDRSRKDSDPGMRRVLSYAGLFASITVILYLIVTAWLFDESTRSLQFGLLFLSLFLFGFLVGSIVSTRKIWSDLVFSFAIASASFFLVFLAIGQLQTLANLRSLLLLSAINLTMAIIFTLATFLGRWIRMRHHIRRTPSIFRHTSEAVNRSNLFRSSRPAAIEGLPQVLRVLAVILEFLGTAGGAVVLKTLLSLMIHHP